MLLLALIIHLGAAQAGVQKVYEMGARDGALYVLQYCKVEKKGSAL